jgi:hypothetical protein
MAGNFIFSVNAVFPVFLVIAFGYFLRVRRFLSPETIGQMNNLVFSFALPAMLFRDVYRSDFSAMFDPKLVFWAMGSTIGIFILLWVSAEIFLRKQKPMVGAFVQGAFRGNYAILGLSLVANILGDRNTGMGALLVAFIVPIYNVFSVIILTAKGARDGARWNGKLVLNILLSIAKNPLIIGIALGFIANITKLPLPTAVGGGVQYLATLGTPLALVAIGGSIRFSEWKLCLAPAVAAALVKTLVTPLVFVTASVLMGFRGEALVVLFVMYATPTAISSYVMAARMKADTQLASAIILISTMVSVFTFTAGIYILKTWEWF